MTQEQYDCIETAKKIVEQGTCEGVDCQKCPACETWCKHENDVDFFVEYILEAVE